jgi:hypothetical protein
LFNGWVMVVSPPSLVLAQEQLHQFIKGRQRQNNRGLIHLRFCGAHWRGGKPLRQNVKVKARMGEVFNETPSALPFS